MELVSDMLSMPKSPLRNLHIYQVCSTKFSEHLLRLLLKLHLLGGFAKEMKPINDASHEAIEPYGKLIHDFSLHDEKVHCDRIPKFPPFHSYNL
jgi:hypothetical protein